MRRVWRGEGVGEAAEGRCRDGEGDEKDWRREEREERPDEVAGR